MNYLHAVANFYFCNLYVLERLRAPPHFRVTWLNVFNTKILEFICNLQLNADDENSCYFAYYLWHGIKFTPLPYIPILSQNRYCVVPIDTTSIELHYLCFIGMLNVYITSIHLIYIYIRGATYAKKKLQ